MKNCQKTKRMRSIRKGMEKYLSGRKKSLERFVDVHYETLYKYALSLITTVYAAVGNKLYEPNKFYIKNDNNEYILTDTPFDENTVYYIKEDDRYERVYPTIEEYLYI